MATKIAKSKPKQPKPKVSRQPVSAIDRPLDHREQLFVDYYLASEKLAPEESAIKAGYSITTARVKSYLWVCNGSHKPHVFKAIQTGMAKRLERIKVDQDMILRTLVNEVTADANDLVQYRRPPCRCCYGKGYRYQFTPNEMEQARKKHDENNLIMQAQGIKLTAAERKFDEQGGLGYDPRLEPNPNCPECFGEGKGEIFLADTRKLDPKARSIYAGVHQGKDGLKMVLKDQNAPRQLLMRHAGMLNDKVTLEGNPDKPIHTAVKVIVVPAKQVAQNETVPLKRNTE